MVQRACEIQVNNSLDKVRELLVNLADDVELIIRCIEIVLKFGSKLSKLSFLDSLLKKELPHLIAAAIYDDGFCKQFKTIADDVKKSGDKVMHDDHVRILENFLEQITDLISVNIYFKVDQLIDLQPTPPAQTSTFKFSIAAAKLLRPPHDTQKGDIKAATEQISEYIEQDSSIHELFKRAMPGK